MAVFKRGGIWWYKFYFAGRQIRESSKSTSKTVAKLAEQQRHRELEAGFLNVAETRQLRICLLREVIDDYLKGYRLRFKSATYAEYALGHVSRLLGSLLIVDIDESLVLRYQEARLKEKAAPKSVNEEVRFLLKMLGDPGEIIRAQLRKKKQLKLPVRQQVGKAFDADETKRLFEQANKSKSPHIYTALMLARNAGLRDAEIKTLTWRQIDLDNKFLRVGHSKTEAGEGRTVPFNAELAEALFWHREWYLEQFGATEDDWYLFAYGRPMPHDPTRHVSSLKTAWKSIRDKAKVKGRWHDNRHTLITELAESGAGDETIMQIAGHVSRQMLRHYSHIRMSAKRDALDAALALRSKRTKEA
jgi:integrase